MIKKEMGIELTGGRGGAGGGEVELELLAEDAGEVFAVEDGDEEDEDQESEEVRGEARLSGEGRGGGGGGGGGVVVGRRRLHFREAKLEFLMTQTKT